MLIHLPSEDTSSVMYRLSDIQDRLSVTQLNHLRGTPTRLPRLMEPVSKLTELLSDLRDLPPLAALGLLGLPPFGAGVKGAALQAGSNEVAAFDPELGQWIRYIAGPNTRNEETLPDQLIAFHIPEFLPMLAGSLSLSTAKNAKGANLSRMILAATPLVWALIHRTGQISAAALNGGLRALAVIREAQVASTLNGKDNWTHDQRPSAAMGLCFQADRQQGLSCAEMQWRWDTAHKTTVALTGGDQLKSEDWQSLLREARSLLNQVPENAQWSLQPVDIHSLNAPTQPRREDFTSTCEALEREFKVALSGKSNSLHQHIEQFSFTRLLELLWCHQDNPQLRHPAVWRMIKSTLDLGKSDHLFNTTRSFTAAPSMRWTRMLRDLQERGAAINQQELITQLMVVNDVNRQWQTDVNQAWAQVSDPTPPAWLNAPAVKIGHIAARS